MLNQASLLLGLSAWVLGLTALAKRGSSRLSAGSFTLCGLALVVQFFEIGRRVAAWDWAALMDTLPTLTLAASVLLAVTALLNFLALGKKK